MSRFTKIAQSATSNSFVTEGRNKVSTQDIMTRFPNGITITGFDILSGKDGNFPAIRIAEDDSIFFFGGTVLSNITDEWKASAPDLTCKELSEELLAEGGVKVRLFLAKNKQNREYVSAEVIG